MVRTTLKIVLIILLLASILVIGIMLCSSNTKNINIKTDGNMIELPAPETSGGISVETAINQRRSVREYTGNPPGIKEISQLLWAAQGITGANGNKRAAPSAGMTYPLEVYLIAGDKIENLQGIYKYEPEQHSLKKQSSEDRRKALSNAGLRQKSIKEAPAVIVITAVVGRTVSRYPTQGERYVFMEAGHAAQNMYLQCESLGLGMVVIGAFGGNDVKNVLQLPEKEKPLYIIPFGNTE
jgi:SagB-type dehydrogenase family enzyme